jgi:hypothetical protein
MGEPQDRAPDPPHWHIFRREEDGSKQHMLPVYRTQRDAMAAAALLKLYDERPYDVEACQDQTCHA